MTISLTWDWNSRVRYVLLLHSAQERKGEMLSPSLPCPEESPNPARRISAFPLKPGLPEPARAVAMLAAGPRCYETGMLYIQKAGVRFAAGPALAPSTEDALCFPAATKQTASGSTEAGARSVVAQCFLQPFSLRKGQAHDTWEVLLL